MNIPFSSLFTKRAVGLDVTSRTVEVVELTRKRSRTSVASFGRADIPSGVVSRGAIIDADALEGIIKDVFLRAEPTPIQPSDIVFGFSDEHTFSHFFSLSEKQTKEENFDTLVHREIVQSIPIPEDDLIYGYRVLRKAEQQADVLVIAASRTLVWSWFSFFHAAGFGVEMFESESLALFRALVPEPPDGLVGLVDIGAVETKVSLFDATGLRHAMSIPVAGDALTAAIAAKLSTSSEDAEAQKRASGLSDPDAPVFAPIVKELEKITQEIHTTSSYVQDQTKQEMTRFVLAGGSSRLPGIDEYFSANFDPIAVSIGTPSIMGDKGAGEQIFYTEAVGLAMRGVDQAWDKRDPAFSLKELQRDMEIVQKEKEESDIDVTPSKEEMLQQLTGLPQSEEIEAAKRIRRQVMILGGIGIVGVSVLGGAWWYRTQQRAERVEALQAQITSYALTQSFDASTFVVVDPAAYRGDRVRGRIVETIIPPAADDDAAVVAGKDELARIVQDGEVLWENPVLVSPDGELAEFPLSPQWLVYTKEDARRLLLGSVGVLESTQEPFELDAITFGSVVPTDDPTLYTLDGTVSIFTNQLITVDGE
jgi:type IV pilus assembly protein PilM